MMFEFRNVNRMYIGCILVCIICYAFCQWRDECLCVCVSGEIKGYTPVIKFVAPKDQFSVHLHLYIVVVFAVADLFFNPVT